MSDRFIRLPGSARRYRDTLTGEEISRRERDKRLHQPAAERFVRLPGSSRRYRDMQTGEELSRREYDRRRGKALPPKRRPQAERSPRIKPFPESKKLPDSHFLERATTHRWFRVRVDSTGEAPRRTSSTQRFQLRITCDVVNEKTGKIYPNVYGYSSISYKWWFNYKTLLLEACRSAMFAALGSTNAKVINIREERIITRRFLRRSKRNRQRERDGEA